MANTRRSGRRGIGQAGKPFIAADEQTVSQLRAPLGLIITSAKPPSVLEKQQTVAHLAKPLASAGSQPSGAQAQNAIPQDTGKKKQCGVQGWDAIPIWANIAALVAFFLNACALYFTARQLKVGRRGASAGALIALNESFRQAWLQFTTATDSAKQYAFSDVMNVLEQSCAIFEDKLFVGKAGKVLEDYLCPER